MGEIIENSGIGQKKVSYGYKDGIFNKGHDSLIKFLFHRYYLSGIVLKRESLDIYKAKKYIGFAYIHLVLMAQAMISGGTLTTSKIFVYQGVPDKSYSDETGLHTYIVMNIGNSTIKGKSIYTPSSRLIQLQYRKRLIYEITNELPRTRKELLKKERKVAAGLLARTFSLMPYSFFKIFPNILKDKDYSKSLIFWLNIPKYFMNYFFIPLIQNKKKRSLIYLLNLLRSRDSSNIRITWTIPE